MFVMTVQRNQGRVKKEAGMMKDSEGRSMSKDEVVERNKDINNMFSKRDDPWPS